MSKRDVYYSEAERLYVVDQMTIEEVASRLNVAPRTVRYWKEDEDWDGKRKKYLKSKQTFHEELYEFAKKLMHSIKEDLDNGEKVDTGRMYAFTRMLPLITKIKEYEDVSNKKQSEEKKGLTQDVLALIEEEVLGIRREAP